MAIALTVEELIHIYLKETLTELKNDIYCLFFFGEVVVCLNLCLALSSSLAGLSVSFFPLPSLSPRALLFLYRRSGFYSDGFLSILTQTLSRWLDRITEPACVHLLSVLHVWVQYMSSLFPHLSLKGPFVYLSHRLCDSEPSVIFLLCKSISFHLSFNPPFASAHLFSTSTPSYSYFLFALIRCSREVSCLSILIWCVF